MLTTDPILLASLEKKLAKTPLVIEPENVEKLVQFVQLIHKWNKAYNLTSVRDPHEMLIKHILDSIVVAPLLDKSRYIDVGTGPGLPGIPLAILLPQTHFTLLDSLGKRIRFIRQACHELKIGNVEPVQSRVEEFQPQAPFDGVLSRAFASIKDMLQGSSHLVNSEGAFLALKGQLPSDEIENMPEGYQVTKINKLEVPELGAERHLIQINNLQG